MSLGLAEFEKQHHIKMRCFITRHVLVFPSRYKRYNSYIVREWFLAGRNSLMIKNKLHGDEETTSNNKLNSRSKEYN